ncbi:hypothetical protein LEAN103870_12690 [Legionella anisa]|uniref:hypothetical protein n=1 Tax=Legionella anisa TaxID=28082 RepID=UPI00034BF1FD|nr:hypothetical protein [Legionella anisa]KTC69060.1 hypothetical protein Lani_2788 [Legionella anisa]MCW8423156.1 hypothetical protein [Legionella anisa]MCW8447756.1 hypothetical protein [Legionella anisa]UAK78404.1 hypothetical protein K8O89_12015 [Legionella anisa]
MSDMEVLECLVQESLEEEKENAFFLFQEEEHYEQSDSADMLDWNEEFDVIRSIN